MLVMYSRQVCVDMGACELEQFEFVTEPLDYTQEQWDDKCYTCQAFAKDLEVKRLNDVCTLKFALLVISYGKSAFLHSFLFILWVLV